MVNLVAVAELVDAVIARGLAIAAQCIHAHFGHTGSGDTQETAADHSAQLHRAVALQVVPALAFGAAEAGGLAGVGQVVERIGAETICLHGGIVELLAVHPAGDGTQLDVAAARHQVGPDHLGQHVGVDAVEGQ